MSEHLNSMASLRIPNLPWFFTIDSTTLPKACYSSIPMEKHKDIQLFSRPLILGASISVGYGTRDGGIAAVLARMMNPHAEITNKAMSGATSVQSTSRLNFESFNPSIVLGFDLFFWDAARQQVDRRFEENTRRLFDSFQSRNIPMIIGRVPVLDLPLGPRMDGIKKSGAKVNALLEELCVEEKNCLLYDPVGCFLSMESDEFFSDGLHLTSEGNRYCASYFVNNVDFNGLTPTA